MYFMYCMLLSTVCMLRRIDDKLVESSVDLSYVSMLILLEAQHVHNSGPEV